MSSHGSHQPVDVFRKSVIVTFLLVALLAMYRFVTPSAGGEGTVLLAVGFVILGSYTIGELAEVVKLPHITGYLLAGLLLGGSLAHTLAELPSVAPYLPAPFDKGLLSEAVLGKLGPMDTLALALICLTAGGELKLEELRSGLKRILSILGIQTLTIVLGVTGLFWLMSGPLPFLVFEPIANLPTSTVLALGLVLSAVSLATAPAATIAIINSTGSKGPMTQNVLPVVVLKDVVVVLAFSAASAIAISTMPDVGGGSGMGTTLLVILASIALGTAVGGLVHLYLRYAGAEILLFIVGMVYATAEGATVLTHWIDPTAHAELALVFIAAGFTTSNFSSRGDDLIHEVERLSLPVYVVFFTMAGAKLHITDLISSGLFALLLVVVRIAMLFIGVRAGAVISGADSMTRKYGWMGFISQAGLALTLAATVQQTFGPEVGAGMFSLILAGVALNEILGPVLLQAGLKLAGETAAQRGDDPEAASTDAPTDTDTASPALLWERDEEEGDPWGPPVQTQSAEINEVAARFEGELSQLVRDLADGPIAEIEREAEAYLRALRRDFLRYHRRLVSRWNQDPEPERLGSLVRSEMGDLASRWRDHLLSRSATLARPGWSPLALQNVIDQRVTTLPSHIIAPFEVGSLDDRAEDSRWHRLSRGWYRLRGSMTTLKRNVAVRELARYHFQGHVASRLEGLAALIVNADLHLAERTSALFNGIDAVADRLIAHAITASAEEITEALEQVRVEVEEDFKLALGEVDWIESDAVQRASAIVGGAMHLFKMDLHRYGTPDLPPRSRRFKRLYNKRNEGLKALTVGLSDARATASARYGALALAFEVVTLEGTIKEAVDDHGTLLARQLRGKGLTQLERVSEGFSRARAAAEALLMEESPETDLTGVQLAHALREAVDPVARITEEAEEAGRQLRDWLASEASDEPLLDAILTAAQTLTESYAVPAKLPFSGEWSLPERVATTTIPFREVAVSFIEANITRELIDITRRRAVQIDSLVHTLQDAGRVLTFNAELAIAELDVHHGPIPPETRTLAREMVLGSWARTSMRLTSVTAEAQPWPEEIREEIRQTVLTNLDEFRAQVFDGRITALGATLMREVQLQGRLLARAGGVGALVRSTLGTATSTAAHVLGDERIAALRHTLGFVSVTEVADPEAFAAPPMLARLPTVYRRLFSDQALEAGDLLTGREEEVKSGLAALRDDRNGLFRTVALIGLDGIGKRALANALVRGVGGGRVVRKQPEESVDVETVQSWFDESGGVLVVDGFEQLFQVTAGGFAPLKAFVHGIVEDAGRTAIVALFDTPVWHYGNRVSGLEAVFAKALFMRHLSAEEIQTALIARHSMSGYQIQFEAGTDLAWHVADLLARDEDPQRRRQTAWFRTLHAASEGVMHDALALWMASIVDVDETNGVIRMGPVPQPPVARIRRLPEDVMLVLRSVLSQGWTTDLLFASQFRVTPKEAELQLAALAHAGLLTPDGERYMVSPHLRAPVVSVLSRRGWLG